MSTLVAASPELKRLWIRVLKRVHPAWRLRSRTGVVIGSRSRGMMPMRDVMKLHSQRYWNRRPSRRIVWEAWAQAQQATPPQSTPQPPLGPQHPLIVSGQEAVGILWPACAVLCLLLSVIFDTLSETVGRYTSLSLLVLLTAAVLWLITRNSRLSSAKKQGG